jgi:Chaperone of endosialidase
MKRSFGQNWFRVFCLLLFVALRGASLRAQGGSGSPNASTAKPVNINEIDVTSPLNGTGTVFSTGFTGPKVMLGIADGAISNAKLANSSLNIGAGIGLMGGGQVGLGGSLSLSVRPSGITNEMLAGGIQPAKIAGTAATLGENIFSGTQTVSSGNLALPATTDASNGVLTMGGDAFAHAFGGGGNFFVGPLAGNFTMSGGQNTGVGTRSLILNTTGWENTATGLQTLSVNTSGVRNTANGAYALLSNTTGSYNTAVGAQALANDMTGTANIAIGALAGYFLYNGSGNIYIGNGGVNLDSNTIRIGFGHTKTFIAGINGVTTGGIAVPVVIDENGQLGTAGSSSRRVKFDIKTMDDASNKLLQLRPVTFRYKQAQNDGSHPLQYGLIAEEVAEVYPELVRNSPEGEANTVLYHVLPAMLLNELQKQHRHIEAQDDLIKSLQRQVADVIARAGRLQAELNAATSPR